MIKVPRKPAKRPMETTISLINIVFLMLIFFLVAGRLAPPQDADVKLSKANAPALPPPDALYAHADGSLRYRERTVNAEDYLAQQNKDGGEGAAIRLAADRALKATDLLQHVSALYRAGAKSVVIVTRTGTE
ncbi:biopolymer transporter ExbD [Labrenzia sp. VG12]|uniref:ExbD/TolR family protein n=1 Tax=Labrenzia sp. VG12 TaxID=2021862 RepID=UPI000B8BCC35|nr:biopolymer transporter ExbD [Labrenzia sp. VG12]ASP34290.1 biopolymer transporter ExbD [Labrenzia sp. VG12]